MAIDAMSRIQQKSVGTTKSEPPALDTTDVIRAATAQLLVLFSKQESIEAAIGVIEDQIKTFAKDQFSARFSGVSSDKIPSSVKVVTADGRAVLVSFQNRYHNLTDENAARAKAVLGEKAEKYISESFEIKIDGDMIPKDKLEQVIEGLVLTFECYGALDALSKKPITKLTKEYHTARFTDLSVDAREHMDDIAPGVVSIKKKGTK
jgi:hypothetical protein